jgi:hypothetical protein
MTFKRIDIFLFSFLGILLGMLLIGQIFGCKWAGANGYQKKDKIMVQDLVGEVFADQAGNRRKLQKDDELKRGETIFTEPEAQILLQTTSGIKIALHERAQLNLQQLQLNKTILFLEKGRLMVLAKKEGLSNITILTSKTEEHFTRGAISVVNYDFLQKVRVIPLNDTDVEVVFKSDQIMHIKTPIDILETNFQITQANFDGNEPPLKLFYDWAINLTSSLP